MEQPRTLTIKEAAKVCGVTVTALRRRCDRGALRYTVVDGVRRIPVSELEKTGLLPDADLRALQDRVARLERELAETRQLTVRAESALEAERDAGRRLQDAVAEERALRLEVEARERELIEAGPIRAWRLARRRRREHAAA